MSKYEDGGGGIEVTAEAGCEVSVTSANGYDSAAVYSRAEFDEFIAALHRAANIAFPAEPVVGEVTKNLSGDRLTIGKLREFIADLPPYEPVDFYSGSVETNVFADVEYCNHRDNVIGSVGLVFYTEN